MLQKTPAPGFLTKPSRGRCDAQNEVIGAKIKFIALQSAGILHQKFGLCTRFRAGPPNVAPGRWSCCATISVSCVIPDLRAPAKCLTPIVTDKEPGRAPLLLPSSPVQCKHGGGVHSPLQLPLPYLQSVPSSLRTTTLPHIYNDNSKTKQ